MPLSDETLKDILAYGTCTQSQITSMANELLQLRARPLDFLSDDDLESLKNARGAVLDDREGFTVLVANGTRMGRKAREMEWGGYWDKALAILNRLIELRSPEVTYPDDDDE